MSRTGLGRCGRCGRHGGFLSYSSAHVEHAEAAVAGGHPCIRHRLTMWRSFRCVLQLQRPGMTAGKGFPGGCSPWGADPGQGSPAPAAPATETRAASLPGTHVHAGATGAHVCPDLVGWGGKNWARNRQPPPAGAGHLRAVSHCEAWEENGQ